MLHAGPMVIPQMASSLLFKAVFKRFTSLKLAFSAVIYSLLSKPFDLRTLRVSV
jgi:hypothetical protein